MVLAGLGAGLAAWRFGRRQRRNGSGRSGWRIVRSSRILGVFVATFFMQIAVYGYVGTALAG
jgi:hypothetical protein